MILYYQTIKSPIGNLYIATDANHLRILTFETTWNIHRCRFSNISCKKHSIISNTIHQLDEYFNRDRKFFDLPIHYIGTEFQKLAWKTLLNIPYGETISYQEQANRAGCPKSARAIGGANKLNPLSIIIPCHRVIGKSGKLTGFAGGIDRKKYLLDLEKKI